MSQDEKIVNVIKDLLREEANNINIIPNYFKGIAKSDIYTKICEQNGITHEEVAEFFDNSDQAVELFVKSIQEAQLLEEQDIENHDVDEQEQEIEEQDIEDQDIDDQELDEKEIESHDVDEQEENQLEENEIFKYSDKAKKLLEKVKLLNNKMRNDDMSLAKKHILALRIKLLVSKIQREIDIQNIKEDYEWKKEELAQKSDEKEKQYCDDIAKTTEQIKRIQRMLNGNKEYDYESSQFAFPKEYVDKKGGIESFTKNLKKSREPETILAATKIEQVNKKRQELEKLQKQLEKQNVKLNNNDRKYNIDKSEIDKEEKFMILSRNNIFTRVKDWFKEVKGQISEYFAEAKKIKEAEKNEEKVNAINEACQKDVDECNAMYEARIQVLLEEVAALKEEQENEIKSIQEQKDKDIEQAKEQKGKDIEQLKQQNRSEMAKSFQERISNMENYFQGESVQNFFKKFP